MMSATKPTPPSQILYPPSGLLQSSYPRVAPPGGGGLPPPDSPLYSPAAAAAAAAAAYASHNYSPFAHSESSAFYSPLSGEGVEAWRNLSAQTVAAAWAYDPNIVAAYPYGAGYGGLDVRRKNATRESTSTLKAWLFEHIKNPYPTKGEKIMLAIITKMTLTQVSTWFANARRRLKKENKMQWSPRNRTGEDDDDDDKNSDNSDNDDILGDSPPGRRSSGLGHLDDEDDDEDIIVDSGNDDSQPHAVSDYLFAERLSGRLQDFFPHRPPSRVNDLSRDARISRDDDVRISRDDDVVRPRDNFCRISLASAAPALDRLNSSSPAGTNNSTSNNTSSSSPKPAKPKIWSLADVATSVSTSSTSTVPAPPPLLSNNSPPPSLPPNFADFRSSLAGLRVPLGLPGTVPHSFQPWSNGLYSAAMQSLHGARLAAAAAAAAGLPPGYVGGYLPLHQGAPGAMQAAHHAMISGALQQRHQLGMGGPGMGIPARLPLPPSSLQDSPSSGAKPTPAWASGKPRSCASPADITSSSPDDRDTPPVRLSGGGHRTPRLNNGFHSPSHSSQEIDIREGRRLQDGTSAKVSNPANHSLSSDTNPAAFRLLNKRL